MATRSFVKNPGNSLNIGWICLAQKDHDMSLYYIHVVDNFEFATIRHTRTVQHLQLEERFEEQLPANWVIV